jgi:hypothetical protein
LHVINGEQPLYSPWEEELTRIAAAVSDMNLIMTDVAMSHPPRIIFGREPEHGWCYYYQQASLAMQKGDWELVRQLGAQAERQGLQPGDPVELIPFIKAKLQLNNDVLAMEKEIEILEQFPGFREDFCQYHRDAHQDKIAERVIKMFCAP